MSAHPIVVIGAGLAGLRCTLLLQQAGLDAQLFEAKSCMGGRIAAHQHGSDPTAWIELGPSWFWPHQPRIAKLLDELEIGWFQQHDQGDGLYQIAPDAPPQRITGAGAMQAYRVEGSVTHLVNALARQVRQLHLDHELRSAQHQSGAWTLRFCQSDGATVEVIARHLVIASPPRVAITMVSNLREHLSYALQSDLEQTPTWMAAQAKFVATYATPFWRHDGLAGDAISRVGPLVEIHDASSYETGGSALFGFVGIPALARHKLAEGQLAEACLVQLGTLFGTQALAPSATALQDWSLDRHTATRLDLESVPRHPEIHLSLYDDELNALSLSFASTEVAAEHAGYLEGALDAAARASEQVMKNLK